MLLCIIDNHICFASYRIKKLIRLYISANDVDIYIVTILLIFTSTYTAGKTLIGSISFTVNYLWAGAVNIWFLYFYLNDKPCGISTITLLSSALIGSLQ